MPTRSRRRFDDCLHPGHRRTGRRLWEAAAGKKTTGDSTVGGSIGTLRLLRYSLLKVFRGGHVV